jgi:FAD/FMN-containing dehydrogenase
MVRIPPVDEKVESFTLISPAKGRLEVSREGTPELFKLMNVGLGCFGVIKEMTIKCVEDHYLREETLVKTWDQIKADHRKDLLAFRHLRYLWIPYTREAIVVRSNPVEEGCQERSTVNQPQSNGMRTLLKEHSPSLDDVDTLGIAQMRDHLLEAPTVD